jgi:succinoglycan biosynthesis protein ExoM
MSVADLNADVAVIVPTFRRPDYLRRALSSLFAQRGVAGRMTQIVVVDNDPEGTARNLVATLAGLSPCELIYRHEPTPGVATARNSGLRATDAPLIAFLDDDEKASPHWLSALLEIQAQTGADVVFGPIRGRVPDGTGWTTPYLERFFGRSGSDRSGLINRAYGCGNSLLLRATALPGPSPFNTAADEIGGEDDLLFQALQDRGGRFAWAAEAWVDEFAPAHRANLAYALRRAFTYGQGPTQAAAGRRNYLDVARWMAIGLIQTVIHALRALVLLALRDPRRADAYDRMAQGLGKMLWMKGFEPKFYGAHELARLNRQRAS